jgi:PhnB protein
VKAGGQVHLSLNFTDAAQQDIVWNRLAAGATVAMPLGDQFFGRFGMLTDKFGIPWMLHFQAAPAK